MTVVVAKTPSEVKDFSLNWATDLGTDTISSSAFAINLPGPSITQSTNTTQSATGGISGGVIGTFYQVTNTINTAGGRTLTKTFMLEILATNNL
jgi:hypothetical protein